VDNISIEHTLVLKTVTEFPDMGPVILAAAVRETVTDAVEEPIVSVAIEREPRVVPGTFLEHLSGDVVLREE
jgi:hypothetical protein